MKKQKYHTLYLSIFLALASLLTSCERYLEEKPDKKLAVPATLTDLQALLDNYTKINIREPIAGEVSSDDYYLSTVDWLSIASEEDRRTYTWEKDFLFSSSGNSWSNYSEVVYFANTVLEQLNKINRDSRNAAEYDNIKGQAYVTRAKAMLQAAYIWTMAYDEQSAEKDFGLPLRLTTDFNQPSVRSSVKATYDQIIADLKIAVPLIGLKPLHVMRASKPAAYGLLARTYLSMRAYQQAGLYADSCLQINSALMNYNELTASATFPVKRFNAEVIMETTIPGSQILSQSKAKITRFLFDLYAVDDLRKIVFFKPSGSDVQYKGSYEGNSALFGGIATDEMYLIRAECSARTGNSSKAMEDLNKLLINRYKTGKFTPLSSTNASDALALILLERRKELLMRGIRWIDIKRLNKEGYAITLKKEINNQTFELKPNDLRYALPLPEFLIDISGMLQNPR